MAFALNDVFDALVGQDEAVVALRRHVRRPVHAYLVTGPASAGHHEVLGSFATALQCPEWGCAQCDVCHSVALGQSPDVTFIERTGVSWRLEEIREAGRVARRRPLVGRWQIVVLEDIELSLTGASPTNAALLKILEEPPPTTIFLLSASEVSDELATIRSRCVQVSLAGLSRRDVRLVLEGEGVDSSVAELAASAADGDLSRARFLADDPSLVDRLAYWRAIPDQLGGTPSHAAHMASTIEGALSEAVRAFGAQQDTVMRQGESDVTSLARKDRDAHVRREQRRFRREELRAGLRIVTEVYRDRLRVALGEAASDEKGANRRVSTYVRALECLARTNENLSTNADESLLIHELILSLEEL